jgi:hypothetical protein
MRSSLLFAVGALLPSVGFASPAAVDALVKRENLCSLKEPPALCKPDPSVTVEETAQRAYKFYRAFIVDGDPKTMFSLIDNVYKVSLLLLFFCGGNTDRKVAKQQSLHQRPPGHLVLLLRREEDRNRSKHILVLRCQHQHVICQVFHCRPMAMG